MAYSNSPAEALMRQIATLEQAKATLQAAIDDLTGSVNPETATWKDVSRQAHLVDAVKRAELVTE